MKNKVLNQYLAKLDHSGWDKHQAILILHIWVNGIQ